MANTKLNADVQAAVVELLEAGNRIQVVCDSIGISKPTFYSWINQGEEEVKHISEGGKPRKSKEAFLNFFNSVKKATADSEKERLKEIIDAAKGGQTYHTEVIEKFDKDGSLKEKKVVTKLTPPNWQASAWYLERRQAADYGRKDHLKVQQEASKQFDEALERLEKRYGHDPELFNGILSEITGEAEEEENTEDYEEWEG